MNEDLKVAILQADLVWENAVENRINFTNQIILLNDAVDLIILPEMFTTGFSMNAAHLFETMTGDTVNWMQKLAVQKDAAITGSIIIKEKGNFYNRLLFVHPDGAIDTYDKRHTFTLAGEGNVYKTGVDKLIVNYKGWKICPLICYDLRFPVWSRNTEDYHLLLYVANWPKVRISAWDALLRARAIENMSYCIGVNRVGLDGNGYKYVGHSSAYNTLGDRIDNIVEDQPGISIVNLSYKELSLNRDKLNFLIDRDSFEVNQKSLQNQN